MNAEELLAALVNLQLQDTTKSCTRGAKTIAEMEGIPMVQGKQIWLRAKSMIQG